MAPKAKGRRHPKVKQYCLAILFVAGFTATTLCADTWPFQSVVRRDGQIIAVVSDEVRGWYLHCGHDIRDRVLASGESLVFVPHSSAAIYQHSASMTVTAHFSPPPAGLRIAITPYHSSSAERRRFFIQAR
jgi:hypothetical protein